jgi:hypothetical protein
VDTRMEEPKLHSQHKVVCVGCGRTADEPPLTWSRRMGRRGIVDPAWLCDRCTREHLREIEAELDDIW